MKTLIEVDNMIRCAICNGTGIQEETVKGYRRYKCWSCKGKKVVTDPFPSQKETLTDEQDSDTMNA